MKLKFIFLLFFQISIIFSQKIDLQKSILTIPVELKENANAVVRKNTTLVTIKSEKNMTVNYHKVITVLNSEGNIPYFMASYDKYTKFESINIIVYNKFGKVIKKVKKKEINDVAYNDNYTLFSDDRYKYYQYIANEYPFTIEVNYTINTSDTAFIPKWYAYEDYYIATQNSTYIIKYPNDLKLNYKEKNFKGYKIEKKNTVNSIIYSIENFKAIVPEPLSPSFMDIVPNTSFALNKFSLAGKVGIVTNWNDFGKWIDENLLKGRGDLPENTKNDIKNLVKDIKSPLERAKLVYEYMQNRTRYISVQIGIGGWKPMLSKDVDRLGYGDCKALSYYTKSLLEEANVKAEYTIVYSGDKKNVDKNLVSVQGNHAILMLPSKKDTIWLECTNQKLPFGQTGDTDDRDVLVVSNNIGKIIHTTKYPAKHNLCLIKGSSIIDEDGNMKSDISITSSGKEYNKHFYLLYKNQKEKINYYKNRFYNLIDLKMDSITLKNDKKKIEFKEVLQVTVPNYAEKIATDLILPINSFSVENYLPPRVKEKKYPFYLKSNFLKETEITIKIPTNYTITSLPQDFSTKNDFGEYKISIAKIGDNQLFFKRKLLLKEGKYSNTKYNAFRNFIKEIIKKDTQKIILSKK